MGSAGHARGACGAQAARLALRVRVFAAPRALPRAGALAGRFPGFE
jgi:hypothetical protein